MVDVLTPEQRSYNMSAIKGKNTSPEIAVRRLVHGLGYRFRLHRKDLPGKPDLVFPARGKVLFVHGCFWHMHRCRYGAVTPASNAEFWSKKREGNVRRDVRVRAELKKLGWRILVVWECQVRDREKLVSKVTQFLES